MILTITMISWSNDHQHTIIPYITDHRDDIEDHHDHIDHHDDTDDHHDQLVITMILMISMNSW